MGMTKELTSDDIGESINQSSVSDTPFYIFELEILFFFKLP